MKVRFTPTCRTQFLEAITYIHHDNPSAAVSFREKAEKALSRLKKYPESGRFIPEFPDLPFREMIVRPYRFFYGIKGDTDRYPCRTTKSMRLMDLRNISKLI